MGQNARHGIYIVVAVVSAVWAWSYGISWMAGGGDLLNLPSFFIDAYKSGSAAAFLTIDILFVWGVFILWVITDAKRIGLGLGWGIGFALLSGLGTCLAFPLYLVKRERFLTAEEKTG